MSSASNSTDSSGPHRQLLRPVGSHHHHDSPQVSSGKLEDFEQFLLDHSLTIVPSPPDGHCLMHSINIAFKHQLNLKCDLHKLKCGIFVETLINLDNYLAFLSQSASKLFSDLSRYIIHKNYNTAFGDLIPLILANFLNLNLIIIEQTDNGCFRKITVNSSTPSLSAILVHKFKDHYNGISLNSPDRIRCGLVSDTNMTDPGGPHRQRLWPMGPHNSPSAAIRTIDPPTSRPSLELRSSSNQNGPHRQLMWPVGPSDHPNVINGVVVSTEAPHTGVRANLCCATTSDSDISTDLPRLPTSIVDHEWPHGQRMWPVGPLGATPDKPSSILQHNISEDITGLPQQRLRLVEALSNSTASDDPMAQPASERLTYTSEELHRLRPENTKVTRAVRKAIFANQIWLPRTTRDSTTVKMQRPFDLNNKVHHHLLRSLIPSSFGSCQKFSGKCLLLNARSVRNKSHTIREHIIDNDPTLSMFTETWLQPGEDDIVKELTPDGYFYLGKTRPSGRGGGVAIIYKAALNSRETVKTTYDSFEHLSVVLHDPLTSVQCHISIIYRPPSSSIPKFLEEFENHLHSLSEFSGQLLVTGDINLHLEESCSSAIRLHTILEEHSMSQYIQVPTHTNGHTLDFAACHSELEQIQVIPSQISDHFSIIWHWDALNHRTSQKSLPYQCRQLKNFSEDDFQIELRHRLEEIPINTSVNELCGMYTSTVSEVYDKHAPIVIKSTKRSKVSPWITPAIRQARILRRVNECKWRKTGLEIHRQIYCQHRQDVNNLIIKSKQQHYEERLATRDPKATFQVINELTKLNSRHLPAPPSKNLCNQFMEFFQNKISAIHADIAKILLSENLPGNITHDISPMDTLIMDQIRPVTEQELVTLIKSANSKTSGLDPCPTALLKQTFGCHLNILLAIFNKSFEEGIFPSNLKKAQVTPLLKSLSMDKHILKNYRPISNLPTIGKFLERIGILRLVDHLVLSNKVEDHQSAYKAAHSTETALLKVFNDISLDLDKGRHVLMAMIDLSAAFDTICHKKLAKLLEVEYGIRGKALSWYKSYFENRTQFCKLDSFTSDTFDLTSGCPQGSVIGPVAFNLYTAPMSRIMEKYSVQYHKYADDLQVYISCRPSELSTCRAVLEQCLSEIRSWMFRWGLKINDSKTEYIIFRNRSSTSTCEDINSINIGSSKITISQTVKNLGVMFESTLNRSPHITAVIKSCNYHLRQLGRIRKYITAEACKRAVHALIISRLDYCNSLLIGAPGNLIEKLQRIQNRAARLVLRPPRGTVVRATSLHRELSWLPVRLRITFKLCVTVFKCINGLAPKYLTVLVSKHKRDSRLRQPVNNNIQPVQSLRKIGESSFRVAAPAVWNSLPTDLKLSVDLLTFRKSLKTYLWKSYC